jgi:UDP-N-acetylglucosamine 2-epimerase (non-hydrolysing)
MTDVPIRERHRPRIMLVFGTRPEAIKVAPVALTLRNETERFETICCSTGQHREMLIQTLRPFGLVPDVDLGVMRAGQSLAELSSRLFAGLDEVMGQIRPDLVIVQGDTTTAMVSALTAYYHHIPVAHLEAGLRTRDIFNPFPEEANRRVISLVSSLHFAPTDQAARALAVENVPHEHVTVTGNTVIDALMHVRNLVSHVPSPIGFIHSSQRVVLLTMHRRESVGQPFEDVCNAVLRLTERNENIDIAFPVHPSPVVREPVTRILGNRPRIHLLEPLDYLEFIQLLDRSYLVLTDSGGVQEEAPALGKPVLVLRETTERPESIEFGTARLVGTDPDRIVEATERLVRDESLYRDMAKATNPYGDGQAAQRVVGALSHFFGLSTHRPEPFATSTPSSQRVAAVP